MIIPAMKGKTLSDLIEFLILIKQDVLIEEKHNYQISIFEDSIGISAYDLRGNFIGTTNVRRPF